MFISYGRDIPKLLPSPFSFFHSPLPTLLTFYFIYTPSTSSLYLVMWSVTTFLSNLLDCFHLNLSSGSVCFSNCGLLMAVSMGMASGSWIQTSCLSPNRRNVKWVCCSSASLTEQYRTLRIEPGASEKEVKKAFRQLALKVGLSLFLKFCGLFLLILNFFL